MIQTLLNLKITIEKFYSMTFLKNLYIWRLKYSNEK